MLHAILKLFRARKASHAATPEPAPAPTPKPASAPAPRQPGDKRRKYGKRKRPMPKGARRIDPNGNLLEQARQAGDIKR
ncbi:hypothetical protein [Ralstonia solanacearum]|uniref:hypothetical protein n=1 Tax=Ralstonia solanacearum TaxID=305 RepID=UPI0018D0D225|nr:hypothetical protein [Ralstonia solanacearum]